MTPKKNKFQIILTSNGKRIKTLYSCKSEETINDKFRELVHDNKKVKFPVRYINTGKLEPAHYEIFIIEYNEGAHKLTRLRNADGKIISFGTDGEGWVVYEREDYDKEESFWVYGFHPVHQRKDYQWILDELISKDNNRYEIKQVFVFQNKLLISTTNSLQMVLCKNISDCIRLYNSLDAEVKENKIKHVYFSGDAYHSKLKKEWYEKLKELTGWTQHKLSRNSLRP